MSRESPRLSALEADWTGRLRGALGRPLRIHAELDSAMDLAHALAERGEGAGACVLTEHQRAGRGRRERRWHDAPGASLMLALILRPDWPPERAGLLALAAGLAFAEAGARQGAELALKWPNDVLAGGRKVAGVLTEARLSAGGYRHLILGLGANVHTADGDLPPGLAGRATSLDAVAGRRLSRGDLLADFLAALAERLPALDGELGAPAARRLRADWSARWAHAGRRARDGGGRSLRLLGLAPDGALRVEGPAGMEPLRAGELELELANTSDAEEAP